MEISGIVIRQLTEFGDATGLGKISGEYFGLAAGFDTTLLCQGLDEDAREKRPRAPSNPDVSKQEDKP